MMNIIGISAHYHDSAAALLVDGELVAAAQEERFSRVKNDAAIPLSAFRFCLDQAGLNIDDIDALAYYENPAKKLERQLSMGILPLLRHPQAALKLDSGRAEREIRELLGYAGILDFHDHHQSHAASAFFPSGYEEAAILVADGVGEWTALSYGTGRGSQIELFEEVSYPDSLGLFYSAMTAYLGFEVNEGEYKVMGLAAFGQPSLTDRVRHLLHSDGCGGIRLSRDYFRFDVDSFIDADRLATLLGSPPRAGGTPIRDFDRDLAASVQAVLEEVLLEKVRYLHRWTGMRDLCMAGGVALNCVANNRILQEGPFERLFVQPAAGDAGTALGAALLSHAQRTGRRGGPQPLASVFLGRSFGSPDIRRLFSNAEIPVRDYGGDRPALERDVADRIACGEVIGWLRGQAEFGPRSLGARSILADPRRAENKDRVNLAVKRREPFRPFAPAVLREHAADLFRLDVPSPFMLLAVPTHDPAAVPACIHVDGTARVQTVDPESCPNLHGLLQAFLERTGCPVLINTSFNLRGEPIVDTPLDALATFLRCDIDCLVLEDLMIDKRDVPQDWLNWAREIEIARQDAPPPSVYTLL